MENTRSIDNLTKKISEDKDYRKNIIQNYEFAQKEFEGVGINLTKEAHEKFRTGFEMMGEATTTIFGSKNFALDIPVSQFE